MKFLETKSVDSAIKEIERLKIKRRSEKAEISSNILGRILAMDIIAGIDMPSFNKSLKDGYALIASDTFSASENNKIRLEVIAKLNAGEKPDKELGRGKCAYVATGAMLPKNADAVAMIEEIHEFKEDGKEFIEISRAFYPGENIMQRGSDVMKGELVLREGERIDEKTIALLSSLGINKVKIYAKPKIGIIATGTELVEPGEKLEEGKIYNSNLHALSLAVFREGGEAISYGIVEDDLKRLEKKIKHAITECDILLLSGGTSKGKGDLLEKALENLNAEIRIHGIAMKPGKPLILAILQDKIIFGLPGNPTSCLFSFNLFVSPLIRKFLGYKHAKKSEKRVAAKLAISYKKNDYLRHFLLVNLSRNASSYFAMPIIKESASVRALHEADGYIIIPEDVQEIEENSDVEVILLREIDENRIVFIGSHCFGVELLRKRMKNEIKIINIGSEAGLKACESGYCDIAGLHMLSESGEYNIPFIRNKKNLIFVHGYLREQGIMTKNREIKSLEEAVEKKLRIINRNLGSGTRILLDFMLKKMKIKKEEVAGYYDREAKTHSAVASAIKSGEADFGIGIRKAAEEHGLSFIHIAWESYDFVVNRESMEKSGVKEFLKILGSESFKKELESMPGFKCTKETGKIWHAKFK